MPHRAWFARWGIAALATALLVLAILVSVGVLSRRTGHPAAVPSGPPSDAFVDPGWRRAPFAATVDVVPTTIMKEMAGVSWHPGCPVELSELRLVRLSYWGFDHAVHPGELVVHASVADAVVRALRRAYELGFVIRGMHRLETYAGNDDAAAVADNSSAFHCPATPDAGGRWAAAAYGKAVNLNPVENPKVVGQTTAPAAGSAYLDRGNVRPGMLIEGDGVTSAFAAEGFTWGGSNRPSPTYSHFETTRQG